MRRFFISFREIDRQSRESFEGILKNPTSPLRGIPISSRDDIRNQGEKQVKNYIKDMIDQSNIMITLIGNVSHNSKWIDYEIDVATSKKKPILGVRIPDTTGGEPELFKNRKLELVEWDASLIKQKVDEIL